MLKQGLLCISLILTLLPLSVKALSEPSIVSLENAETVEDAVAEISNTLESQGFEIVLTLDHSANAASVGLVLEPTTVIFARLPKIAEKFTLRKGVTVGIDLPIKFLVFEQDGEILLATNSVGYLIDRHALETRDFLINGIDKVQDQFGTPDDGLITLQSTRSIEDTALSIQDALRENGSFGIPLVLDFGDRIGNGNAPVLIVFGNPACGHTINAGTAEHWYRFAAEISDLERQVRRCKYYL